MSSQAPIPKLMDTLDCYYMVTSVAFHPTEPLLATGISNSTTILWKLKKKKISLNSYNRSATYVATLQGHSYRVYSVAFHPTAPLLATGSMDNTAKLWRLSSDNSSATCVATLEGHNNWVHSVAFHPSGKLLATGSIDTTKLWRLSSDNSSATCVATLQHREYEYVVSVAFHPTAPLLATGSIDHTAKLWRFSPDGSTVTCVATLAGHSGTVNSVAFHPNGTVLATCSNDKTAKLWRVDQIINDILAEPAFSFGFQKNLLNFYSVFSTINKPTHYLLSYDYSEKTSGISRILDGLDPEKKIQILDHLDHRNRLLMITKARMSAMLVQKLLIDYKTGRLNDILKFATAILSRRPRISSATCAATLKGHSSRVNSVAFHPTAPLLATCSNDKTAKLWQLNYRDLSNYPCVATLDGHSKYVNSVAFHPTEPLLATGGDDGKAKLWKIKELLLHIAGAPQRGGAIIRHHKKHLSRKVKRYASKRIKKNINININKYRKSKKAKTKTKRYHKFR